MTLVFSLALLFVAGVAGAQTLSQPDEMSASASPSSARVDTTLQTSFSAPPTISTGTPIRVPRWRRDNTRDLMTAGNSRPSIAYGVVIDLSTSMISMMSCNGTDYTRLDVAKQHIRDFIDGTVLNTPSEGIQDQLTICTYRDSTRLPLGTGNDVVIRFIFPLTNIDDTMRVAAQQAVDTIVASGSTPTGAALRQMIDTLATSPLRNRAIVLLTDGAATDLAAYPIAGTIARARAAGIRIFCLGIDVSDNVLRHQLHQLGDSTGGFAYEVYNCDNLQDVFDRIADSAGNTLSGVDVAGDAATLAIVSLTPNPTHGDATLELTVGRGGRVEIELYDGVGIRLMHRMVEAGVGSTGVTLPTADLPSGSYIVRVRQGAATATRSLVVAH